MFKVGDKIRITKKFFDTPHSDGFIRTFSLEQSLVGEIINNCGNGVWNVDIGKYRGMISEHWLELAKPRNHPLTKIFR